MPSQKKIKNSKIKIKMVKKNQSVKSNAFFFLLECNIKCRWSTFKERKIKIEDILTFIVHFTFLPNDLGILTLGNLEQAKF